MNTRDADKHTHTHTHANTDRHTHCDLGVSLYFLCRFGTPGSENVTQAHQNRNCVHVTGRTTPSGRSNFTLRVPTGL